RNRKRSRGPASTRGRIGATLSPPAGERVVTMPSRIMATNHGIHGKHGKKTEEMQGNRAPTACSSSRFFSAFFRVFRVFRGFLSSTQRPQQALGLVPRLLVLALRH